MERIPPIAIQRERLLVPKVERLVDPVTQVLPPPIVNSLQPPVVNFGLPNIVYPQLPPMAPPPSSVSPPPSSSPPPPPKPTVPKQKKEEEKTEEKAQPAPLPTLPTPPKVTVPVPAKPLVPTKEIRPTEMEAVRIEIAGKEVSLPTPQQAVQASATAVVGTSVTLATAMVFKQVRKVVGEAAAKLKRNKFKVKLRQVKPVLHFVDNGDGGVEVIEYSGESVKVLASDVKSPEQFLRDTVEADELFELDHRIVIDDHLKEKFSKEGAKRFNYFAPSKKIARRLVARFIFG
jgi:hypothetical protein